MAVQKPLVLINGQIQQIPPGDTLSAAASQVDIVNLTAGVTVGKGCPVYISSANTFNKAGAGASGTSNVIGLASAAITSGTQGPIQTDGVMTATTAEWDAVAGTTGGLTAGTTYYLSATAGMLTSIAPSGAGQYVIKIGTALSATDLEITIGDSILLT